MRSPPPPPRFRGKTPFPTRHLSHSSSLRLREVSGFYVVFGIFRGAGAVVEGVWVGVQKEVLERCRGSVRGSEGELREG